MLLTNAPGATACLPQREQRVPRLVEVNGGEFQQIESCLDQLGVTDDYLYTFFESSLVPRLTYIGCNC